MKMRVHVCCLVTGLVDLEMTQNEAGETNFSGEISKSELKISSFAAPGIEGGEAADKISAYIATFGASMILGRAHKGVEDSLAEYGGTTTVTIQEASKGAKA